MIHQWSTIVLRRHLLMLVHNSLFNLRKQFRCKLIQVNKLIYIDFRLHFTVLLLFQLHIPLNLYSNSTMRSYCALFHICNCNCRIYKYWHAKKINDD